MTSFPVVTCTITSDSACIIRDLREEGSDLWNSNKFPSGILVLPGTDIPSPLERQSLEKESSESNILLNSLSSLARSKHRTLASGPITWKGKNGKFYRRTYLLDENGSIQGHYDQCHLPKEESVFFEQGEKPFLFSCCGTRIAILHAYELLFPEYTRSMALSGAGMIIVCGAKGPLSFEDMKILFQARCLENCIFLAAVCAGEDKGMYGTAIFSPSGADISEKISSRCYGSLIDRGYNSIKDRTGHLSRRRPHLYHPVTEILT